MAIFNMVGGGGGLSATDAILRVIAPAGSTVTISKGSVSKSDAGHENASDNSVYDYYFIIHSSQFDSINAWTVTATLGYESTTKTIIIDSADEYDVVIYEYGLLYNSGLYTDRYTHGTVKSNATITDDATYIQSNQTGNNYYAYNRWENVDLTHISTITFVGKAYDSSSSSNGVNVWLYITQNANRTYSEGAEARTAWADMKGSTYQSFSRSLDVSNYTGLWYVCAGHDSHNESWSGSRKLQIISVTMS